MNKYSYTAYISPLVQPRTKKSEAQYVASNKLDDFSNRLDRSCRKLNDLNILCETNLDKCKIYYDIARNY